MLLALILAFIAGVAMAVQGSLNAALSKIIGLLQATLLVHVTAAVTTALLLLFPLSPGSLGRITQAPWYLMLGGIIGVLITYGVVASIPRAGAALATTAIIVGQVTTALAIDHWGLFGLEKIPFTWTKALGVGLLALGACLMLRKA